MRSVRANRPDLPPEALERTRTLMDQALPDALVEGYERHIERLVLPDPDDRHVLAAALAIGADAIVTFNHRDFPASALAPHALEALHPDTLVVALLEADPAGVLATLRTHRRTLRRSPLDVDALRVQTRPTCAPWSGPAW
ncbi:MAG: hypothetical protein KatS3mg043_1430 [Rhodothermaceae bacterium]|nr:MAG: hypothetical protein KatS3mg043_1430 [Rhodothermaceae bacterium]